MPVVLVHTVLLLVTTTLAILPQLPSSEPKIRRRPCLFVSPLSSDREVAQTLPAMYEVLQPGCRFFPT